MKILLADMFILVGRFRFLHIAAVVVTVLHTILFVLLREIVSD